MAGKSGKEMLSAGTKAPEFRLRDANGNERTLAEIVADGPALLAFFKSSCPVCQFTMPYLERVKDNGKLRIIGVSQDNASTTEEFCKEFGVSLPMLLDEAKQGYPASNGFQIAYVPTMFQVEPDGTISQSWTGWSKADMIALGERAGQSVLHPGEQVPVYRPG
jgi:peroxiredoxin